MILKNVKEIKEGGQTWQISEEEIGKLLWKRIQSNDSKDDPKSRKQNGGTDRENTRSV